MKSKEFKTKIYSHAHSLIRSLCFDLPSMSNGDRARNIDTDYIEHSEYSEHGEYREYTDYTDYTGHSEHSEHNEHSELTLVLLQLL